MDVDGTGAEESWIDEAPAPKWSDFERAAEAGKEILERLAGDRSTLRRLLFTAPERCSYGQVARSSPKGKMIQIYDDPERDLIIHIHLGTAESSAERTISTAAVIKVLAGQMRHTWYRAENEIGYVTIEQPPGLFAIRDGLEHSLAWSGGTVSLVLGSTVPDWCIEGDAPLDVGAYTVLCNDIDSLGVV